MSGDEISNTEPEADKERKLLEGFLNWSGKKIRDEEIDSFLSSLRKPAFELICQDGVVTDPEQIVYWNASGLGKSKARDVKEWGYRCWISESAALEHRRHNTPAIKLSDMEKRDIIGIYYISVDAAHNLVNERIK